MVHPNAANPDDSVTLASAALVRLTRTDTITDKDNDSAVSASFIDIGQALNFEDDGPNVSVTTTAPADALTVDETLLGTDASANFADNFTSVSGFGQDGAGTLASGYALSVGGGNGSDRRGQPSGTVRKGRAGSWRRRRWASVAPGR